MSSKILNEKKPRTVALVTLGCARNETDSEELAGRLAADGWQLVTNPADAEIAVINTCGFIESAKKDSIDALIQAHSLKANGVTKAVVAVGESALIWEIKCKNFSPSPNLRILLSRSPFACWKDRSK